jgi:hypothetical protein
MERAVAEEICVGKSPKLMFAMPLLRARNAECSLNLRKTDLVFTLVYNKVIDMADFLAVSIDGLVAANVLGRVFHSHIGITESHKHFFVCVRHNTPLKLEVLTRWLSGPLR